MDQDTIPGLQVNQHAGKRGGSVGRTQAGRREAGAGSREARSGAAAPGGGRSEPGAGRPEAVPRYIANRVSPPSDLGSFVTEAQVWRRLRYTRRQRSSSWLISHARQEAGLPPVAPGVTATDDEWVRPLRPARCRWRVAEGIGVHGGLDQPAHYSGTERCASIWACPVCSAVIRSERAADIQQAVETWQARGGAVAFVTLTLRHTSSDALADTLDGVLKSWQRTISGAPWLRWRDRLGIAGMIRAVEITWGEEAGWHPHAHVLLLLDTTPTPDMLAGFESWLYARWSQRVTEAGCGMPTRLRGVDVRMAGTDGTVVAQYLAKIQEVTPASTRSRIGAEMARHDLKSVRKAGRFMPFELLDAPADDDRAYPLWTEYVVATRGRRAITWTRGLRELVDLDEERSDDEILDDTEQSELVLTIPGRTWDELIRSDPDRMAAILEAVEIENVEAAMQLASGGYMPYEGDWVDMTSGEIITPHGPGLYRRLIEDTKRREGRRLGASGAVSLLGALGGDSDGGADVGPPGTPGAGSGGTDSGLGVDGQVSG